jgi:hypothetical protein
MKRYVLKRVAGEPRVMVVDTLVHDGQRQGECSYPLRHLSRHSPDGFEWGYSGSGPADLARSIVGDLLRTTQPAAEQYLAVKTHLVAQVPRHGGEITEQQVRRVLLSALEDADPSQLYGVPVLAVRRMLGSEMERLGWERVQVPPVVVELENGILIFPVGPDGSPGQLSVQAGEGPAMRLPAGRHHARR